MSLCLNEKEVQNQECAEETKTQEKAQPKEAPTSWVSHARLPLPIISVRVLLLFVFIPVHPVYIDFLSVVWVP